MFRKRDLFRLQVNWKTPTQLGGPLWLRLALSKRPAHMRTETSTSRNVLFSSFYNTGRWKKSKSPVILSVTHHRQNSLEEILPLTSSESVTQAERVYCEVRTEYLYVVLNECYTSVLRPAVSTHVFSILLCFQANSEVVLKFQVGSALFSWSRP
jgi:hypothetical protein